MALAPLSARGPDLSVVRRVLGWMRQQPSEGRARAVSALARTYLGAALPASVRAEALVAMTAALDDSSVAVRRALAEALASASEAPRHIVFALAGDRAEVARPILGHSPLLDDSLLAEIVRHGRATQQLAVARRPNLGESATWAIADVGDRVAAITLAGNPRIKLSAKALRRVFDRFSTDGELREALVARGGLPAPLRVDLAVASAAALSEFGKSHAWLEAGRADRLRRDAREQAIIDIARDCSPDELPELAEHLRTKGFLNVGLLMRGLLSGDVSLFETALVAMSGAPARRVAGFLNDWRGRGFAAIYGKAGLPPAFLPAFRAALGALQSGSPPAGEGVSPVLALRAIEACESLGDAQLGPVLSLMWRLAGEGARDEAKQISKAVSAEVAELAHPETPQIEAQNRLEFVIPVRIEATPSQTIAEEADFLAPQDQILEPEPAAPLLAIEFDPIPAMEFELELAAAELMITEALNQAPRLDFVASQTPEGDLEAPALPPPLEFAGANENAAPPITIDLSLLDEVAVAA